MILLLTMTCNISIFTIGLKDDRPCIHETGGVQTRTTETVEPREASEILGLKVVVLESLY